MIKKDLDYKLVNLTLLTVVLFLIYKMGNLWLGIISKIMVVLTPFIIAFVLAYALHPILKKLEKKLPKVVSILIIVIGLFGVLSFVGITVVPTLFEQLTNLFSNIITFVKEMSIKHNLDVSPLQDNLTSVFNDIVITIGKYVSDGALNIINLSLSVLSTFVISISVAIYFLIDMSKIRINFKKFLLSKNKRHFEYISMLDNEMKKYLGGFAKMMVINTIVYFTVYSIVGHPNALLIGVLAGIANIIPFFGAISVNLLAFLTASVNLPFPGLLIKTSIAIVGISVVDAYFTNPFIFSKSNRLHPVVIILAAFAGAYLFGIIGIAISIPFSIIIITTYKFYKKDIHTKISDIKRIKN